MDRTTSALSSEQRDDGQLFETLSQVRSRLRTAILANQPALNVVDNADGTLTVVHQWPGVGGNVTMTENVANAAVWMNYLYDPDAKKLYLYLGDVADNVRYTLCNNVKSATFSVDSVVKNNASHVVRVAVTMDVVYGSNHIQLSGSAAPRREVSYE